MKIDTEKLLKVIQELQKDVHGCFIDASACIFEFTNSDDGSSNQIHIKITSDEDEFIEHTNPEKYQCVFEEHNETI